MQSTRKAKISRKTLQCYIPVVIILVTIVGWVVFLSGFSILASCDLRSSSIISHGFVILLLPAYVFVGIVNIYKNHYWPVDMIVDMINTIISTTYIYCCGNSMCLFWISVASSDRTCSKLLVGNALGLTGTIISAMFVATMLVLNPIKKLSNKKGDAKLDTLPLPTVGDSATLIDMKKNEVYGVSLQQADEQQSSAYEEMPSP